MIEVTGNCAVKWVPFAHGQEADTSKGDVAENRSVNQRSGVVTPGSAESRQNRHTSRLESALGTGRRSW